MTLKQLFAAATILAAGAVASTAQAHAKLQSSDPQAGSTLATAPKQVRLKFNEALEPAFSKIKLSAGSNTALAIPASQLDKADPTVLVAPLPALGSGSYRVQWSVMTHDGHKVKGEYAFQVK